MARPTRVLWFPVTLALACDPGMDPPDEDPVDEVEVRDCSTETRADTYVLGMRKSGASLGVSIIEATPAPPSRGDNLWRVRVQGADGTGQAATVEVDPFMPDHNHGSSIRAHVTADEVVGEYRIEPVNLFMPGLWEITLDLTLEDGTADAVVFRFCVDP